MENLKAQIASAIGTHLGEQPKQLTMIRAEQNYLIARIELTSSPAIFKAARGGTIGVESWGYQAVAKLGVPTPTILAIDLSRSLFPYDFFIAEEAQGMPLAELWAFPDEAPPLELRPLIQQAGRMTSQMHAMPLKGFGRCNEELFREHGKIRGWADAWATVLLTEFNQNLETLSRDNIMDANLLTALRTVVEQFTPLLAQFNDPRLLHGDLQVYHILVHPDRGSVDAFIDFGDVAAGDPVWELAIFSVWEEWTLPYFLEGYAPDTALHNRLAELGDFYRLVRMVDIVQWFHERGDSARTQRALERALSFLEACTY